MTRDVELMISDHKAAVCSQPAVFGYFPTLDGWRAIAILGVLIAHGTAGVFSPDGQMPSDLIFRITRLGAKGVDLFFAISGFLITSRLLMEHRLNGRISLSCFFIRRTFRILPPFFIYICTIIVLNAMGRLAISEADFATSLTFTRNYLTPWESGSWYTSHFWSLCVEEHFYLIWPVLLFVFKPSKFIPWAIGINLILIAWAWVDFRFGIVRHVLPGVGYFIRTDICITKLLIAAAAAMLVEYHPASIRVLLRPWSIWTILTMLTFVCVVNPPFATHFESVLMALLITVTVMRPKTLIGSTLELAPMRWIGRISYSLYLWQQMFLVGHLTPGATLSNFFWSLLATILTATASYYFIEKYSIRLGRRWAPSIPVVRS